MSTSEPTPPPTPPSGGPAGAPPPPVAGTGIAGAPPSSAEPPPPAATQTPPAAPGAAAAGPASPFAAAAPADPEALARAVAERAAKLWWVFLVTGVIWIVAGIVVLMLDARSVFVVGYAVAGILLAMGIQEIMIASAVERLKWLRYGLGIFFLIGGIYALFNPAWTTASLAASLGFLFFLLGVFWILEAVAQRDETKLWLLGLASGILMLGFAVWASQQYMMTRLTTLLVFAGIWAILHGVVDFARAFQLKRLGAELTTGS